jgi:hypothetical protein
LHKVGGGPGLQGHGGNQSSVHTKTTVRNGGDFQLRCFFSRTEDSFQTRTCVILGIFVPFSC